MIAVERVWVPDPAWRLLPFGVVRRCRVKGCGRAAVAVLDRGHRRNRWWSYCEDHLYGRRIENGVVLHSVHPDALALQDSTSVAPRQERKGGR